MRNGLIAPGLALALSIPCPTWATQPTAVANVVTVPQGATGGPTVTGRVTSVGASGLLVSVDATGGLTEFDAITVGDQVQILLAARRPLVARPLNVAPTRRLLGVWLLAMSGVVIFLRVRRRQTFLTSRPRDRKRVVAPASV